MARWMSLAAWRQWILGSIPPLAIVLTLLLVLQASCGATGSRQEFAPQAVQSVLPVAEGHLSTRSHGSPPGAADTGKTAAAEPSASPWQFRICPSYRLERSPTKESDYFRFEPVLISPVGAFGGQVEWGVGVARILPIQQNVFGPTQPLKWLEGTLFTWNAWYGIQLPDESDWDAGVVAGYWGQEGKAGDGDEIGSQRISVDGPFLLAHWRDKEPWGKARGLDLEIVWSNPAIEGVLPDYTEREDIAHIDGKLVGTFFSNPGLDLFGVLYRIQEDHSFKRTNVPLADPLPRSWSFDATEYRIGPGIRYRYSLDPAGSISFAPLLVCGQSTGGYIYPTGERVSAIEDWSAAGEYGRLNLSGSLGLEASWETRAFIISMDLVSKNGDGRSVFEGPLSLPGIGLTTGLFGFAQSRDELFIKGKVKLKTPEDAAAPWYAGLFIEPSYRQVRNRGTFSLDAPVLADLGMEPRLQETEASLRSDLYYLGLGVEDLWAFDRLFLGYGHDAAQNADFGYFGWQVSF